MIIVKRFLVKKHHLVGILQNTIQIKVLIINIDKNHLKIDKLKEKDKNFINL